MIDIVIIGFGGHALSVVDCIERSKLYRIAGYVDTEKKETRYKYLGKDDELEKIYNSGITNAAICIGYLGKNKIRENLYNKTKKIGFELPVIVDPSAIISQNVSIGEGTFVGKGAIINTYSTIGKMVIVNTGAIIEHECNVGDFSHVSVGTVLCGDVTVGKRAFIGANSTVIQKIKIEDDKIIPAGDTVR